MPADGTTHLAVGLWGAGGGASPYADCHAPGCWGEVRLKIVFWKSEIITSLLEQLTLKKLQGVEAFEPFIPNRNLTLTF